MIPNSDPEPIRDWISIEFCEECDRDTDHQFLEFAIEPIVESECTVCQVLRVYEDRRER